MRQLEDGQAWMGGREKGTECDLFEQEQQLQPGKSPEQRPQ